MEKNKITITFEAEFSYGDYAYCEFCNEIRKVKVMQVECHYDCASTNNKYLEYKVYDEERQCHYLVQENRIYATQEDAENYLLNAR